jgi:hypothetical protein
LEGLEARSVCLEPNLDDYGHQPGG